MSEAIKQLTKNLEIDLDWRQAELAVFRELVSSNKLSDLRRNTYYRAAWALLYAHYEGFCKFCLDSLIEFIVESCPDCSVLPRELIVYLFRDEIKKARNLPDNKILAFFADDFDALIRKGADRKEVDTKSNLWPNVLEDLLMHFDLQPNSILSDRMKIRTLVARRNDIAHGKKVFITDYIRFYEYEQATSSLMYQIAYDAIEKAEKLDAVRSAAVAA